MSIERSTFFSASIRNVLRQLARVLVVLLLTCPAYARNANYRLCFPDVTWFGGAAPVIDGNVSGDTGWRGAFRYIFDNKTNGTTLPNVIAQGIKDPNNIYLSFELHKSDDFNDSDVIVLTFDPTGDTKAMRRLNIYPVSTGQGVGNNLPPRQVDFWIDQATWNGSPASLPQWLNPLATQTNLRLSTAIAGSDRAYFLELKIPLTGADSFPLPAGDFGLYLNGIRIINGGTQAAEDSWPPPPDTALIGPIVTNTPTADTWGNGNLAGGPCNGVFITSQANDITANGGTTLLNFPDGDPTDPNDPNNPKDTNSFSVVVHNSTVSNQGVAPQIPPTFYIENYGLPSLWQQIPTGNNPAPADDIDPGSTKTFQTSPWLITDPTRLQNFHNNPHQCVMVQLDAHPPSHKAPTCNVTNPPPECSKALIVNNAAVQNMNFPSVAQGKMLRGFVAQIATKGYALPAGATHQIIDLQLRTQEVPIYNPERPVGERAAAAKGPPQSLIWAANGYRHSGEFITINNTKYEIANGIGAFGYGLSYDGKAPPKWRFQFFGERGTQLEQPTANTYRVHIPQGEVGYVNVAFEGDDNAPAGGPVESPPVPPNRIWWWIIALALIIAIVFLLIGWLLGRRAHA